MAKKVFVGNLNFQTSEERLREFFSAAGNIVDLHIPLDRDTGRPRGFAFITFDDDNGSDTAIAQFNGADLDGRPLRVDTATEQVRPRGPRFRRLDAEPHASSRDFNEENTNDRRHHRRRSY